MMKERGNHPRDKRTERKTNWRDEKKQREAETKIQIDTRGEKEIRLRKTRKGRR